MLQHSQQRLRIKHRMINSRLMELNSQQQLQRMAMGMVYILQKLMVSQ
ncbi:Uncharacterised protein [Escherichia coli]|nr:Uncharacterised protein [Escherichia coli]